MVVGVVVLAGLTAASLQYYNYYFWQPDAEQHRADLGAAVDDLGNNIGTLLTPPAEPTIDQESLPLTTQKDEPGGYVLEEDVAPGIHGIQSEASVSTVFTWVGNNPEVWVDRKGRTHANTDLPGGMAAADELLASYAGRLPSHQPVDPKGFEPTDEYINGPSEVRFRLDGKSHKPVIQLKDTENDTIEDIHFNP